jgi:hypothetical protein
MFPFPLITKRLAQHAGSGGAVIAGAKFFHLRARAKKNIMSSETT